MVVPAGSAGIAAAPEGVLLRYNSDSRNWERLTGPTPLAASTRLLCLYPSKATITIGKTQVVMIGECEIRILPQSTDQAPAIELTQGWLVFRPESSGTLKVGLGDRLITLEMPQNGCRCTRAIGPLGVRAAGEPGAATAHTRRFGRGLGECRRQAGNAEPARGAHDRPNRGEAFDGRRFAPVGERVVAVAG